MLRLILGTVLLKLRLNTIDRVKEATFLGVILDEH